ncbi:phosphotriesterase-related protein [Cydia amplana]|uniref:phosphotriesterase-related protein n=1 Tax=Cydia amplana TaxID=1869771 RepID=UPI002FE6834C
MSGRVQTVLGGVSPAVLGRTLPHEHLSMEFTHFYRRPPAALVSKFPARHISLQSVGYLRQYPYSSKYNLTLNDKDTAQAVLNDVNMFRESGGGTIVENSAEGLDRDLSFLKRVSTETGVHVVAGTGYYIADTQHDDTLHSTTEEMYQRMLAELMEGCVGDKSIKAGFIGEVASVWPIREFERRAIVAAGEVVEQLGVGVSFHPHRNPDAPAEIIRVYLEAGGRAERAVMSHLDRTLVEEEKLLTFAELGTYCQLDLFGAEVSYYQLAPHGDMPGDARRLQLLRALRDDGRGERCTVSHDIHTKHRLADFGGHGYSHILHNVLPRMKSRGFTPRDIHLVAVENPARWLTIHKEF